MVAEVWVVVFVMWDDGVQGVGWLWWSRCGMVEVAELWVVMFEVCGSSGWGVGGGGVEVCGSSG